MVRHVPLRRNPKVYEDFFCSQAGHGLPVFIGGRSQKGRGLGSFFSGLGRMILPWLKTGGKALLREGVGTGLQVAQDALAGRNVGNAFRERTKEAGGRLLQGAVDHLTNNQSGSGVRRRRRKRTRAAPPGEPQRKRIKPQPKRRRTHKQNSNKNRRTKKRNYSDIFA